MGGRFLPYVVGQWKKNVFLHWRSAGRKYSLLLTKKLGKNAVLHGWSVGGECSLTRVDSRKNNSVCGSLVKISRMAGQKCELQVYYAEQSTYSSGSTGHFIAARTSNG